jgi:hypothetical protein
LGSEDPQIREIKTRYNFLFSSPPYYNTELYCDEATQSIIKFSDKNSWLEKYLFASADNALTLLEDGGIFALNIKDLKDFPLTELLKKHLAEKCIFSKTYQLALGPIKEPILIWKKESS